MASDDSILTMTPAERGKATILIVESDPNERNNFRQAIKTLGFGGLTAAPNHAAAIERMAQRKITHIIYEAKKTNMPAKEFLQKVLEIDNDRERISLSLKATERDPWTEFAETHQLGELVYGKVSKVVPFGSFIQIGDGIEGLVHISEMATHHVDSAEQVVQDGEELWVKIIEIDNERRRISLSIKQAAEGGVVAAEYADVYGEHAYDDDGNFIGAEEGTEETVEGDATTQASSEIPAE